MSTSHLPGKKKYLQYCKWQHCVLPKDQNLARNRRKVRDSRDFTLEWKPGYSSTIGCHYPKVQTPDRDLQKVSPSLPNLSTHHAIRIQKVVLRAIHSRRATQDIQLYASIFARFLYHLRYQDIKKMSASPFHQNLVKFNTTPPNPHLTGTPP